RPVDVLPVVADLEAQVVRVVGRVLEVTVDPAVLGTGVFVATLAVLRGHGAILSNARPSWAYLECRAGWKRTRCARTIAWNAGSPESRSPSATSEPCISSLMASRCYLSGDRD